jgi:dTDP-glucose pyrophosphorylase
MEKAIAILAAGIGSRYGGLKQMDPVGPSGEFIIDYSVFDALRAGFNKVVFIIRRDIEEAFKASIGDRVSREVDTHYTFQELNDLPEEVEINPERKKPWGTVQAVLSCEGVVQAPFAVINADDFYGRESYEKLSQYLEKISPNGVNACMVGFQLGHTLSKHGSVTRGICQSDEKGMLNTVVETQGICYEGDEIVSKDSQGNKQTLSKDELVSMNMWGLDPSLFGLFRKEFALFLKSHARGLKDELIIPTAMNLFVARGEVSVKVLNTSSDWFGVTVPEDKREVVKRITDLVESGEYPADLWRRKS